MIYDWRTSCDALCTDEIVAKEKVGQSYMAQRT
jgi:hypothetical protein